MRRHAYVFYATDDDYGVAVLVFVHLLRQLGIGPEIDVLVLHLPLSNTVVARMNELGVLTREVTGFARPDSYFKHCLLKLEVFELTEYDRVIYLDADALPLRSLDHLFGLPFDAPVAAPRAYWIPQPFWTTALLVVQPSDASRARIRPHLQASSPTHHWHDMDIVNHEFATDLHTLPGPLFSLNSEWEDVGRRGFYGDPVDAYRQVSVVHFTALGKPWFHTVDEARSFRPHAHEIFFEQWSTWRRTRTEIMGER